MIQLDLSILNQKGTPMFNSDIFANRPTFGIVGRIFISTDTSQIFRDTGTSYVLISDTSSGGSVTSVGLSSATSGVTIGSSPITTSGNITLAIATASVSQNGLLSSADFTTFNNKQSTISLTTTGTSGASTFSANTLNIPQYQSVLTNPITGTGTPGALSLFSTSSTLADSLITQSGSNVTNNANLFVTNGNINLPANNIVSGTNYALKQEMATDDSWIIFGNTIAQDQGELVFQVNDNAQTLNTNGERFRFRYEAVNSGISKDPFIIDYDISTFTTKVFVNNTNTAISLLNPLSLSVGTNNTFDASITWPALEPCDNVEFLQNNNYNGNITYGIGSYTANHLILSSFQFLVASTTLTSTQTTGIRALANQILQARINGTNNGTITHFANSLVYGDFAASTARFNFTNRYGYLVNNLDEYGAGHTYTNRYAFYNQGANDHNHFAGKMLLNTLTVTSDQLSVVGTTKLNGELTVNENIIINKGSNSVAIFDTNGSQKSLATGQTENFNNFSGMVMITNFQTGSFEIFVCGGGGTATLFLLGASNGTFLFNASINGYTFTSTGITTTYNFTVFRTRPNA